jgi:hypothetical protein
MRLLQSARLEPPILTRLFQQLPFLNHHLGAIPATLEEAVGLLRQTMDFCRNQDHE